MAALWLGVEQKEMKEISFVTIKILDHKPMFASAL
jgi:hypothetical protein